MTGEMGLGVSLHGSNLRSLMSALGHKRTFAVMIAGAFVAQCAVDHHKIGWNARSIDLAGKNAASVWSGI